MNKLPKQFLTLLLLFFIQCKSPEKISVLQEKVSNRIIIRRPKDNKNRIITIQFPNRIILSNGSISDKLDFLTIDYKYGDIPEERNLNLGLYIESNRKLKKERNNKKKTIPPKSSLSYIIYSRHFVDSAKSIQQQFKPYVAKMLAENKDTLHVGTVTEFKKKHAALFEKLTKGDSISIQFLDSGKFGERVTVPVEW